MSEGRRASGTKRLGRYPLKQTTAQTQTKETQMNAQTQTLVKSPKPCHLWTGSPVCSERARLQDVGGRAASGTSRRGGPKLPGAGRNPVTQLHSREAGMTFSVQASHNRHALNPPASPSSAACSRRGSTTSAACSRRGSTTCIHAGVRPCRRGFRPSPE